MNHAELSNLASTESIRISGKPEAWNHLRYHLNAHHSSDFKFFLFPKPHRKHEMLVRSLLS